MKCVLNEMLKSEPVSWSRFLRELDDLDWDRFDQGEVNCVESLLRNVSAATVAGAVRGLTACKSQFSSYLPHVEFPRANIDKFMLHMDDRDRFRVRLHRITGTTIRHSASEATIHNHRWQYSTRILRGSYNEDILVLNESSLKVVGHRCLSAGDVASLSPDFFHRTATNAGSAPCITLFVRGRSLRDTSLVWDAAESRLMPKRGRSDEVAVQLMRIADQLGGEDGNDSI